MFEGFFHLAFIGPGGPEVLMVMLVLLMMFGAKDAPRILRKLNEIISQLRSSADGFKREVMYGDINHEETSYTPPDYDDEYSYGDDFIEDDTAVDEETDSAEAVAEAVEEHPEDDSSATEVADPEPISEPKNSDDEGGDVKKA